MFISRIPKDESPRVLGLILTRGGPPVRDQEVFGEHQWKSRSSRVGSAIFNPVFLFVCLFSLLSDVPATPAGIWGSWICERQCLSSWSSCGQCLQVAWSFLQASGMTSDKLIWGASQAWCCRSVTQEVRKPRQDNFGFKVSSGYIVKHWKSKGLEM